MCDRCTVMDAKCGEKWAQHTAPGVWLTTGGGALHYENDYKFFKFYFKEPSAREE